MSGAAAALMRSVLRSVLERLGVLIWTLGLHRLLLGLQRRRPVVVLYHACEVRETDFTRGLGSSTTPAELGMHLDFLARHFRVVPLAALHDDRAGERAAVITFDDGYRSVYDEAFPLLRARGMPATVYLVPEVVGNEAMIWVNELNAMLRRHPQTLQVARMRFELPESATADSVVQCAVDKYDADSIAALLDDLRAHTGVDCVAMAKEARLYLDWEQVTEMGVHGFTFGNHTAGHPNLARLEDQAQREAIARGRAELVRRLGRCDSLAYPFGLCGPHSAAIAAEAGHASVMEVGGSNGRIDLLRVARVPVRARTDAQLFAEIAVVEPVKAWAKRMLRR